MDIGKFPKRKLLYIYRILVHKIRLTTYVTVSSNYYSSIGCNSSMKRNEFLPGARAVAPIKYIQKV